MREIKRNVEKKRGYLIIIWCLIALLFINGAEAVQTNCTNYANTSKIYFNYTVPLINTTNQALISYAQCRLDIFNSSSTDLYMDDALMLNDTNNFGEGIYYCPISSDIPAGESYSTYISCNFTINTNYQYGKFEIPIDSVPTAVPLGLIGLLLLFGSYTVAFKLKKNTLFASFFFLSTLVLSINAIGVFLNIIKERATFEASNLESLMNTLLIIYMPITYLISIIFLLMIIMRLIKQIKEAFKSKHEKLTAY